MGAVGGKGGRVVRSAKEEGSEEDSKGVIVVPPTFGNFVSGLLFERQAIALLGICCIIYGGLCRASSRWGTGVRCIASIINCCGMSSRYSAAVCDCNSIVVV